ncbi:MULTISPECIES: hypothetical protein [unclassified Pseudomonas]|nr:MULTISPECIES: hypothetical protein [unclassified Pseudomonas]WLI48679.1 hypothetical protein PSH63_19595 [Pseudomonas sp. FP833]
MAVSEEDEALWLNDDADELRLRLGEEEDELAAERLRQVFVCGTR